jgi:hypothetical protein
MGMSMLRPTRTVRVTTREELDAALATADQVTVEGDDELLTYAVNKAAHDSGHHVLVDFGIAEAVYGKPQRVSELLPAPQLDPPIPAAPRQWIARVRPPSSRDVRPDRAVNKTRLLVAVVALVVLLTFGGAGAWYLLFRRESVPSPQVFAPVLTENIRHHGAANTKGDFWANLPSMLWPLVAIVAIVALFLIAWKAIGSGRNVTIQWKVTENVSGRVVITKVREPAQRRRAAA